MDSRPDSSIYFHGIPVLVRKGLVVLVGTSTIRLYGMEYYYEYGVDYAFRRPVRVQVHTVYVWSTSNVQ